MSTIILKNIGSILSGKLEQPFLTGDSILIQNGKVARVGVGKGIANGVHPEMVIDVNGMTVCPGLIDAHTHPLFADFVPSMKAVDWFDSYLHGGVTSMVSLGEVRQPGRPRDALGAKSLAITARKIFENYRPSGVKVDAGAVMLEAGLTQRSFQELAQAGCSRIGEVGMGGIQDLDAVKIMLGWAKEAGLQTVAHAGGPSLPGTASYGEKELLALRPDVIAHLNGAPTPVEEDGIRQIIREIDCYFDLIDGGNVKAALIAVEEAIKQNTLHRVMLGTNAPSMAGFAPTGLWMLMGMLCVFTDLKPEQAIAMATGNPAACYKLGTGVIQEGNPADLLVVDAAIGSVGEDTLGALKAGDLIGLAMVMIDGEVVVWQSRNTTPPRRNYTVEK